MCAPPVLGPRVASSPVILGGPTYLNQLFGAFWWRPPSRGPHADVHQAGRVRRRRHLQAAGGDDADVPAGGGAEDYALDVVAESAAGGP